MVYRSTKRASVPLRDPKRLEAAMRRANLSGAEVGTLAGTTRQTISQLRRSERTTARVDLAEAIERALNVRRGHLFNYTQADAEGGTW